ncbi:MAG: ATP-dependent RecD-like DNA helicase [Desulfobacteraceae bacterium]|nr:MAG: ATP-dependent RecD-like DNA helicase [Desulfobacteraceae bacterium]
MISLQGILSHITFHNPQNHFTIARLKTDSPKTTVTITGCLPEAGVGESIKITGDWTTHPRYGQQFKFETAEILLPSTLSGIRAYLTSGILKGIGPSTAARIIDAFGEDTFSVIAEGPDRLALVSGIGAKKAAAIHAQWQTHHAMTSLMKFLQENKVNTSFAGKIFKAYGSEAVDIIRQSPYCLANDIPGIGFVIADRIAVNSGIEMNLGERTQACIINLLREALNDGHTFLPETDLLEKVNRIFDIDAETTRQAIEFLGQTGEIVASSRRNEPDSVAIYLKTMYQAENSIAVRLRTMLSIPADPVTLPIEELLSEVESRLILCLSEEQRSVLETSITCRISVITGGPGTGKTTLIKSITRMNRILGRQVCLAAPTGRAARRLAEVTGHKAHTIHKLLEYNFEEQSFGKDQDDPIDADVVIVDEVSMVDTLLMHHLLCAIPLRATIIMVGDAHQLPPVGPGTLLEDMINSGNIPVFYLNTIFRQAQSSPIIVNAHRVRQGELPQLNGMNDAFDATAEFYFIEELTPETVVNTIVDLCARKLPDVFGLHPIEDIQVLTPMHKGLAGTINLNRLIQSELNAETGSLSHNDNRFKIGDKVMHLKNNYQKEVFNGDIGIISSIDKAGEVLNVNYYGRNVEYTMDETDELALGYAISVHKSQGSEYPAVILPLITQHYIMLQRNLLYTAITRAQRHVVIVGSKKALSIALKNNTPQMRCSGLADRLKSLSR